MSDSLEVETFDAFRFFQHKTSSCELRAHVIQLLSHTKSTPKLPRPQLVQQENLREVKVPQELNHYRQTLT